MDLRKTLFESSNQIEEILEGQIRMQPADYMELRDGLRVAGSRRLICFFQRHSVSAWRILLPTDGAQTASRHANIRGIDVAIHVEIRHIAVHPLTHMVGQPAQRQNVCRAVERNRFVKIQSLAGKNLLRNRRQTWVISLEPMPPCSWNSCGHLIFNDNGI